eukprot:scaffold323976_cov106-Tisochrysis_lutea.AAC.1
MTSFLSRPSGIRLASSLQEATLLSAAGRLYSGAWRQDAGRYGVWLAHSPERRGDGARLSGLEERSLPSLAATLATSAERHMYVTAWRCLPPISTGSLARDGSTVVARATSACVAASRSSDGSAFEDVRSVAVGLACDVGACELDALVAISASLAAVRSHVIQPSLPLWLLLRGGLDVDASRVGSCSHAGLVGLARQARAEAPAARLPLIEPLSGSSVFESVSLVAGVVGFGFDGIPEPEVSHRGGELFAPRLGAAALPAGEPRAAIDARHVLTGGTGGLGLVTGRWLGESGAASLVLASRSGRLADSERLRLAGLKGCAVHVSRCDSSEVSDWRW